MSLRLYPAGATMANTQRAHPDGLLKTEMTAKAAFCGLFVVLPQIRPAAPAIQAARDWSAN
jgi:hypothetical protein